jgi:hypothetical protein
MRESNNARRRLLSTSTTLLMGGLCLSACPKNADDSTGTLVVPFALGNHRSCDTVGVAKVRAEVDDDMYEQEAPCSNGQVRFKEIPAGSYKVRLFGLDAQGVAVMDSTSYGEVTVNVVGQDTTVVVHPEVVLTATPAKLLLRWNLGFGSCKGTGIDRFNVLVWRRDGDDLLLNSNLSCSTEGDGDDQYREVPDKGRALGGGDVGEVSVQPLDKTGVEMGDPVKFNFDPPGPGHTVKLSIECMDGACSGTGKPD